MSRIDREYEKILSEIFFKGYKYLDPSRKGVYRYEIPSYNVRYCLEDNKIPVISLKKIYYKGAINELICFLNGFTDVREYWKRGVNFWDKDVARFNNISVEELRNTTDDKLTDMGAIYPFQWRNPENDQIAQLIYSMVHNPMSTSLIVNSWDSKQLKNMCLPPCHYSFQVICYPVDDTYEFELHWSQRSTDVFLGLPTNVIFYSLLCRLLELFTGYKAKNVVGDLKNVHLYDNQYSAAVEVASRNPFFHNDPSLEISDELQSMLEDSNSIIKNLSYKNFIIYLDSILSNLSDDMFKVIGYESYSPIKVEMLAHSDAYVFQKGDKVFHPIYGQGLITYKRDCPHPYPLIVEFEEVMRSFTLEGKERVEDSEPTLSK